MNGYWARSEVDRARIETSFLVGLEGKNGVDGDGRRAAMGMKERRERTEYRDC